MHNTCVSTSKNFTSRWRLITLSTWRSPFCCFQCGQLNSINSKNWHWMVGYTLKWDKQCGAYRKLASLQTNASTANLHPLDIIKAPTLLACGADVNHLISSIKQTYKLTKDWTGNLNCCITLEWDYVNHTVNISMPGYIKKKCKNTSMWWLKDYKLAHTHLSQNNLEQRHRPHSHLATHHDLTLGE